jgi:choline dehydrogenase
VGTGYDVLIVGGGAAGCVLARRLGDSGRTVCLLEAGPDPTSNVSAALRDGWNLPSGEQWPYDWGFESEAPAGGSPSKLRRGRVLGGTSWLTRFAVRGSLADFSAWDTDGGNTWSGAAVLDAFRRVEADADFGDAMWHGADGPLPVNRYPGLSRSPIHDAALAAFADLGFPAVADHNAPDAVGFGPMPISTVGGRRVTSLDAWLPIDKRPGTLTIRTDVLVDRVELDGLRATGVRLASGDVVHADEVIVAAGTYGSPSILLRSGIGPADHLRELGIEPVVELNGVGENLADHPGVDLDSGWRGEAVAGEPVLHSIATFRSSTQPSDGPPDLMFWVTDPSGADPAFYLDPILLKPESRGRVRLRSADPASPPMIELPALSAERDLVRLEEGYRMGLEIANHPRIRALASDPAPALPTSPDELRERITSGAYSVPHVVGTCRMGADPSDGAVADPLGRVHGVGRLRVIDASIIPGAPSGFPHLVTIMVAERLASIWDAAGA